MSLVSCITADMQYSMMTSDCEDKSANLTAKLKNITEQGSELGKVISGIDTKLDSIKSAARRLNDYEYEASSSRNPEAQSVLSRIRGEKAYAEQEYYRLYEFKQQKEVEKRSLASQEKQLTAQQKANEVMMKFATAASEKFGKMVDPAIKRFFA